MTTILVVDDEPLIAMALQCALEDAGYDAHTAANGKQALAKLQTIPKPAVILLDMMMPVMNGPATLNALQENPETRDIPVVIVTSLPRDVVEAQAAAAVGIVQKPYSANDILTEVERLIGPLKPA